ncbi:MAG: cytochrome C [Steroidobacterales bacterium]
MALTLYGAAWSCLASAADAPSAAGAAPDPLAGTGYDPAEANYPGVGDMRRAWQHWTLNCQGCHRPDGSGTIGTAPRLAGTVAKFLHAPGGRDYLGQVPGIANSPLASADLAEVVNWMLWRFDREHVPADFQPYTADEIGRLRRTPLSIGARQLRHKLLAQATRHTTE